MPTTAGKVKYARHMGSCDQSLAHGLRRDSVQTSQSGEQVGEGLFLDVIPPDVKIDLAQQYF